MSTELDRTAEHVEAPADLGLVGCDGVEIAGQVTLRRCVGRKLGVVWFGFRELCVGPRRLRQEFQRTQSRLQEMQSYEYLSAAHRA